MFKNVNFFGVNYVNINDEKYQRKISLICNVCGHNEFGSEEQGSNVVKCMRCSCSITKEELLKENEDNVQSHFKEFTKSATKDVLKELKKLF